MIPLIKNIFLDFLNRDSREIFGLFSNASEKEHIQALIEGINVAILLCKDFCIVPPGFLAECPIARKAVSHRSGLFIERLIRLPMRESTLEELFEKKRAEYAPFQKKYSGLYTKRPPQILKDSFRAIVGRKTEIGNNMVTDWMEGLDIDSLWKNIAQGISHRDLEIIRTIPRLLKNDGLAVTWAAIEARIIEDIHIDPTRVRFAVQYHYFRQYTKEFDLVVISRLPFARYDFSMWQSDLSYDYELFKETCVSSGVWPIIPFLSADSLIALRSERAYFNFRDNFDQLGRRIGSINNANRCFSYSRKSFVNTELGLFAARIRELFISFRGDGLDLKSTDIAGVALCLEQFSRATLVRLNEDQLEATQASPFPQDMASPRTMPETINVKSIYMNPKSIAIFVSLREERNVLVKRWQLSNTPPSPFWTGIVKSVKINVYSADELGMGRVAAALKTYHALAHEKPDMLIVTGLAAGIPEEKTRLGDLLVPSTVVDLASRKMREVDKEVEAEFRPTSHNTDSRFVKFLDSGFFNLKEWESSVLEIANWPEGLRPTIRYGPVACLDDVVASDEWRKLLLRTSPKLAGIEMEAGGVCAAARLFAMEAAVVRGVSDLADPAKSDTQWRRIAIDTAASLIDCYLSAISPANTKK